MAENPRLPEMIVVPEAPVPQTSVRTPSSPKPLPFSPPPPAQNRPMQLLSGTFASTHPTLNTNAFVARTPSCVSSR